MPNTAVRRSEPALERPGSRAVRPQSLKASTAQRPTDGAVLIERMAAGDRSAFAALYDSLSRRAYGLALRIVRDRGLAEDVVQEAFIAAWVTSRDFRADRGSAATWILTIVHRRAVDVVRREHVRASEPLADVLQDAAAAAHADPDAIERDRVRSALAALHPREREVLVLAYYGGLTQTQIAARLGTALGTVKSRMFNGLRRLEHALAVAY